MSRMFELRSQKIPNTSVLRRISQFSRFWGFELQAWRQVSLGNDENASRSSLASSRCAAPSGSFVSRVLTTRSKEAWTSVASGWSRMVRTRVATWGCDLVAVGETVGVEHGEGVERRLDARYA